MFNMSRVRKDFKMPLSALMAVGVAAAVSAAHVLHEPPPAPGPESWTFRDDLAKPAAYHAREAYAIDDGYGLEGALSTAKADLARFFASAGKPSKRTLRLRRGKVFSTKDSAY